MTKTEKRIDNALNTFENLMKEVEQDKIRQRIAELIQTMGYNACAEEIRNNRRAKDNAMYALKSYYQSNTGDLINVYTNVVTKRDSEHINKFDNFKSAFISIIEKLENNTPNQLIYFKLKQDYENQYFELAQMYKDWDQLIDSMQDTKKDHEKIEAFSKQIDLKKLEADKAKNALDKFVLDNLK